MNLSILIFITSLLIILLGGLIYVKNKASITNKIFFFFTFCVFIWLLFYSMAYYLDDYVKSLFLFKVGYLGIIFIPTSWLHFTFLFIGKNGKFEKIITASFYFLSSVYFLINIFSDKFIVGLNNYSWGYYPKVNPLLHVPFLVYFISSFSISMTYSFLAFFKKSKTIPALQVNRIKYVFWATVIGSFAGSDFLPNYGISSLPLGFIFMITFVFITAFTVIKYRLLNISVVITRTGIFVAVYTIVLGFPFAIAFGLQQQLMNFFGAHWWVFPLISSTVLASLGPYIYAFIQRKAEDKLMEEQRQYQSTLRQASLGMGQIKDLKRLLNLIVHIVTRTVRLEHCEMYLFS